jgi:hypothetical protein
MLVLEREAGQRIILTLPDGREIVESRAETR